MKLSLLFVDYETTAGITISSAAEFVTSSLTTSEDTVEQTTAFLPITTTLTATTTTVFDEEGRCSDQGEYVTDFFTHETICDCNIGYSGDTCEFEFVGDTTTGCVVNGIVFECYNGGVCSPYDDKPRCRCPEQTAGRQCEHVCREDQFACELDCIPLAWYCDYVEDCPSGKDEENCLPPGFDECAIEWPSVWQCGAPQANNNENICLEEPNCCFLEVSGISNPTDEDPNFVGNTICAYSQLHPCYELACENGGVCLQDEVDGEYYCECSGDYVGDFCDEYCDPETHFVCPEDYCITNDWVCDGESDCENGEDEENCSATNPNCGYYCENTQSCIPASYVCDGWNDCGDYSEEENCVGLCSSYNYVCESGRCILSGYLCDGEADCPSAEDESSCSSALVCPGQFECVVDEEPVCVPLSRVCDGVSDCDQDADETGCESCTACDRDGTAECLRGGIDVEDENTVCICRLGYDAETQCEDYECNIEDQVIRLYNDPNNPLSPTCGYEPGGTVISQPVASLEECRQLMCENNFNVMTLKTDDFVCSVYYCDSWDLRREALNIPEIIDILLPVGYNPCIGVDCGLGECVLNNFPPDIYVANFPRLTYTYACLCADNTIFPTSEGCPVRQDLCNSNPCINGVCTDLPNAYTCACISGYAGRRCQYRIGDLPYQYSGIFTLDQNFVGDLRTPNTAAYIALRSGLTDFFRNDVFQDILNVNDKPVIVDVRFAEGSVITNVDLASPTPLSTDYIRQAVIDALANSDTYSQERNTPVTFYSSGENAMVCDFETFPEESCEFTNVAATFNWTRWNETTPSFETGPYIADSGDWYLYIEASDPRIAGDNAKFRTPELNIYGSACLSFSLSVYGNDMGYLSIHKYTYNPDFNTYKRQTIYREGGYTVREIIDTQSFWDQRYIPVDFGLGSGVYFEFEGTVWTGSRGDLAVDLIKVQLDTDICEDSCWRFQRQSASPLECCQHDYALDTTTDCLVELFSEAQCTIEGTNNPLTNEETREYYSSMSLYSVWNIMNNIYEDTLLGNDIATRACYGNFPEGDIRLMQDDVETTGLGYGRVEVKMNDRWHTICDDGFDDNSARVLCSHLGFSAGEVRTDAFYGQGNIDIFFSAVECNGDEDYIYECTLRQNLAKVCTNEEDVGIICSIENTRPVSYVGPNVTEASRLTSRDDTLNSIFVPYIGDIIERSGRLTQWTASFIIDVDELYLQVWRQENENILSLVGQTYLQDIPKTINGGDYNTYTKDLSELEYIRVEAGDFIGFYFPTSNPIPWASRVCYESGEQLRYVYQPEFNNVQNVPRIGQVLSFTMAPLAWEPCRTYMLISRIDNEDIETDIDGPTTNPPPVRPEGSLFFESFESQQEVEINMAMNAGVNNSAKLWARHEGETPSLGTGPDGAIRGQYYLYAEASETNAGDQFVIQTKTITLNSTSNICVSFLYHMFGAAIGRLRVTMLDMSVSEQGTTGDIIFDKSGSQSEEWLWFNSKLKFRFDLGSDAMPIRLQFAAIMGSGFQGDIAVDNIVIIPGTCPVEDLTSPADRPEAGDTDVVVLAEAVEMNTAYVSIKPGASGRNTNCTALEPCRSAGLAWNIPAKNKTIVFDADYGATYTLNLDNAPPQIRHLNLQTSDSASGLSSSSMGVKSDVTVRLTGTKCFRSLNITNIKLTGNVRMDCSHLTTASLYAQHVTFEMDNLFKIADSNNMNVRIKHSYIKDNFMCFVIKVGSTLHFDNSRFEAPLPRLTNGTALTSAISRDRGATGVNFNFPSPDSSHIIRVTNCIFKGLYQHRGNENPFGAFTLENVNQDSIVKITIENSLFEKNERALDLSVKGDIDLAITDSTFRGNFGNGSGGAIRVTSHLESGLGAIANVKKGRLSILNSTFEDNFAQTSSMYDPQLDIYYQSRSPGSGGAIYVSIVVPSQLVKDGLVSIDGSTFSNNTAEVQGGSIYINPEISTEVLYSYFSNTELEWRPKFGDIMYASCNMTVRNTSMYVKTTDGTTPVFSYQAADAANYRLLLDHLRFECPVGHWIEQLNTTSFSRVGGSGLGTFQVYCRGCRDDEYSLDLSHAMFVEQDAGIVNSVICKECPYGGECEQGILNTDGFWGVQNEARNIVAMYQCPEEYCSQDSDRGKVFYDACASNRYGTLCGTCADGYSESLFGTTCVPNEDCGTQNWWVAMFLAIYGVLYALFFMFEGDWERFISWISLKFRRGRKNNKAENSIPKENGDKSNQKPIPDEGPDRAVNTPLGEKPDNADMGKAGYFQIFMYYIQTASLLKVKIVVIEDQLYKEVYRPQDILPSFLMNGIEDLLSLNIKFLEGKTCLFKSLTVVSKTWIKLVFVGYLFTFIIALYFFSFGCCVFLSPKKRPRLGPLSNTARILTTILSLFLYTYQSVAEDAFLLLNCANVEGESVLFYDGNVKCLQEWQYAVIALVAIFVIPFFTILLFGPKLLEQRRIGIIFFMVSCVFPLFMSVPIILMYFNVFNKKETTENQSEDSTGANDNNRNSDEPILPKSKNHKGSSPYKDLAPSQAKTTVPHVDDLDDDEEAEMNCCCGDVREIRDEIVDLLSGPYRTDIFKGICYEGVLNFRRMIMVVLFTFITDILLRQMALAFACFVILIVHIRARPFIQQYSNYVESIALSLLLIISGTNMVKAAFYHSQTVPRGSNYLIIVIYEWIEAICLGILPLVIIVFILVAMVLKTGGKALTRNKKNDNNHEDDDNNNNSRRRRIHYYDYLGRHNGGPYIRYDNHFRHRLGSHDMGMEPEDDWGAMPHMRWSPRSPNMYRQSSRSNGDPFSMTTHATRFPAFDETSNEGTGRRLPRHSTSSGSRLPRTDLSSSPHGGSPVNRSIYRQSNASSSYHPTSPTKSLPRTSVDTVDYAELPHNYRSMSRESSDNQSLPRPHGLPRTASFDTEDITAVRHDRKSSSGLPRTDASTLTRSQNMDTSELSHRSTNPHRLPRTDSRISQSTIHESDEITVSQNIQNRLPRS